MNLLQTIALLCHVGVGSYQSQALAFQRGCHREYLSCVDRKYEEDKVAQKKEDTFLPSIKIVTRNEARILGECMKEIK